MNNNFYEIPNDWYSEFNNTFMDNNLMMPNNNFMNEMNNFNNNNMDNLANPKVALDRGNLFNNLYEGYKNYKYRELKPRNKREQMLYDILKYNFVLTELNLYLDVNPNDNNMLNLYNKYLDEKKKICDMYEREFGPLTLEGMNMGVNNYNWINGPWPWEVTK